MIDARNCGHFFPVRWMIPLGISLVGIYILEMTITVSALLIPVPYTIHINNYSSQTPSFRSKKLTRVNLTAPKAPPPIPDTNDPYILLGLETPTADKKQIKRAYKRMALQYHPDVRLTPNSTPEEKKAASEDFAKINAAYAFLSGKGSEKMKSGGSSSSTRDGKAGSSQRKTSSTYDPPHRRTGASRGDTFSTNWEDYMPKYDEEYDTNGDSFGAIFNDFVAGSVSSSGGILSDFISFLEGNYGSSFGTTEKGKDDSIEFKELLRNGSIETIKNELDDANLLAKQLEQKDLAYTKEYEEISSQSTGSGGGMGYGDTMRLEERKEDIKARREVVRNYLNKANIRRIKLRKRYEEIRLSSSSSKNNSVGRGSPSTPGDNTEKDSSWKRESFGSNGRRRRRGSTAGRSTPSSSSSKTYSASNSRTNENPSSTYSWEDIKTKNSNKAPNDAKVKDGNIPPHRRLTSTFLSPDVEKRRLREIKVEEKIEEMKRELGL